MKTNNITIKVTVRNNPSQEALADFAMGYIQLYDAKEIEEELLEEVAA